MGLDMFDYLFRSYASKRLIRPEATQETSHYSS